MLMIELTRTAETSCWINAFAVAAIEQHLSGSIVHIVGGGSFVVREPPEFILRLLPEPA